MNIKLNIYSNTGKEIERTVIAEEYDLMFGPITSLMGILKASELENKLELIKVVVGAWDEVIGVLNGFFPSVTADEWKRVKMKELIPTVIEIAKYTVTTMLEIPTDSKNV